MGSFCVLTCWIVFYVKNEKQTVYFMWFWYKLTESKVSRLWTSISRVGGIASKKLYSCDCVKMSIWTWSYLCREHVGGEMMPCVCLLDRNLTFVSGLFACVFFHNNNHWGLKLNKLTEIPLLVCSPLYNQLNLCLVPCVHGQSRACSKLV